MRTLVLTLAAGLVVGILTGCGEDAADLADGTVLCTDEQPCEGLSGFTDGYDPAECLGAGAGTPACFEALGRDLRLADAYGHTPSTPPSIILASDRVLVMVQGLSPEQALAAFAPDAGQGAPDDICEDPFGDPDISTEDLPPLDELPRCYQATSAGQWTLAFGPEAPLEDGALAQDWVSTLSGPGRRVLYVGMDGRNVHWSVDGELVRAFNRTDVDFGPPLPAVGAPLPEEDGLLIPGGYPGPGSYRAGELWEAPLELVRRLTGVTVTGELLLGARDRVAVQVTPQG